MLPKGDWRQQAACLSADPDLFFPVSAEGRSLEQVAKAKAICARCRVRRDCLAFALATRQAHGVWGGMSEQERRPMRSAVWTRTWPGARDGDAPNVRPAQAFPSSPNASKLISQEVHHGYRYHP
jgi:WhiB family redox-sensing transcriptional regulator